MKDNYMKNITAASLERYLLLNEWVRNYDFSNKNMMVFELGDELLAFPASEMFADFYIGLPNVLETLAYLSGKSIRDITREIVASYHVRTFGKWSIAVGLRVRMH